jgi:hypothetical protein
MHDPLKHDSAMNQLDGKKREQVSRAMIEGRSMRPGACGCYSPAQCIGCKCEALIGDLIRTL